MSGVLSGGSIERLVAEGTLIVENFNAGSVRPASYNVTIAETGLIYPEGKSIAPAPPKAAEGNGTDPRHGHEAAQETEPASETGAVDSQGSRKAADVTRRPLGALSDRIPRLTRPPVVLEPGDTAVFSSRERFQLPSGIAGNVTVKNSYATDGLMLLSGLLIDPGYGGQPSEAGRSGCPLYLHVANIGGERLALIPGIDDIARIQFLHVDEECSRHSQTVSGSRWENQRLASLGFLSDLKQLKQDVERTETRTQLVLAGGVVVILVALIGAAFSSILSIATDHELVGNLQSTWGSLSAGDAALWAALIFAAGALTLSLVLGAPKALGWLARRRRLKKRPGSGASGA